VHLKLKAVLKERRRLLLNQLQRKELLRNQLNQLEKSESTLTKSSNTLPANQQERKKEPPKKEKHLLPRDQYQRRPHLCHHQVERNLLEQLIR